MSALSGITVSADLASIFADAVQGNTTRFIKVSIQNESLVHDLSVPIQGTFQEDLAQFQGDSILQNDSPAYILAKLDLPSPDWVAFHYVPDSAKVREKMLYASTRSSLIKTLGSSLFTESVFATSKADLTADAYAAHLQHIAAPNPLSSREQELADLRVAENAAASYEGSQARKTHVGTAASYHWSPEAEEAIVHIGRQTEDTVVILRIEATSETLHVHSMSSINVHDLASALPRTEPSYVILSWGLDSKSSLSREIIFIYCCPSGSPVKLRMLYASGARSTHSGMKNILTSSSVGVSIAARGVEISDPNELSEDFLKVELGWSLESSQEPPRVLEGFARPKGPPRRR